MVDLAGPPKVTHFVKINALNENLMINSLKNGNSESSSLELSLECPQYLSQA
jgi:hypothetical protein